MRPLFISFEAFILIILFSEARSKWPKYVGELDVLCPMNIVKNGFDQKSYLERHDFPLAVLEETKSIEDYYYYYKAFDSPWLSYQQYDKFYMLHKAKLFNCFLKSTKADCIKVHRECLKFEDFWSMTDIDKMETKIIKFEVDKSLAMCYYFCVLTLKLGKIPEENFRKLCPDPCRNNPCQKVDYSSRKCT